MILQKRNHIRQAVLFVISVCLYVSCSDSLRSIPVGTKAQSDSVISPKEPLFESGRLREALYYVDSAFRSLPHPTVFNYVSYYGTHAYINGAWGNYVTQLKYVDSGIRIVRRYLPAKGLSVQLSNFLTERGEAHFNLKDFAASYEDYFEAMQMAKKYSDTCSIELVLYNIAMILYRQQQFEASAQYFMETLHYTGACEKYIPYRNNKEQEVLDNVGLCYTKLKKYDSAMYYYRSALEIVKNNKYRLAVDSSNSAGRYAAASGVIMGNMAKIYVGTNRPDSAIAMYKQAIAFNGGHEFHDMQLCMIQLADVYLSKKDLVDMKQVLDSLQTALGKGPAKDLEADYNRLMYSYYQRTNNASLALSYLTGYMHKRDSTIEQQKLSQQTDIGKELKDKEQQFEIELLQKDNQLNRTYLWLLVVLSGMVIVILVLIYSSYRGSKKNVQKLMELNRAVTAANRDKDKVLRAVAHDLRNPIGGISSLSQILLGSDKVMEKDKEFLQMIAVASASAFTLINELLRGRDEAEEAGEKKMTDLSQLIRQVIIIMQFKAAEKGQNIMMDLPKEPVPLMINSTKIERVVNNLLANAIKFSPVNTAIQVAMQVQKNEVQVSIQDHGIGISGEHLQQVFDQFTSLKRSGTAGEKSYGLGLSICKQIIEEQGGKIWVESTEGKGSTFYISLPSAN